MRTGSREKARHHPSEFLRGGKIIIEGNKEIQFINVKLFLCLIKQEAMNKRRGVRRTPWILNLGTGRR
jgi:hypothetical protein